MNTQKPTNLIFRIDPDTKQKLSELAGNSERSMSGYIRWIIQREYQKEKNTTHEPITAERTSIDN